MPSFKLKNPVWAMSWNGSQDDPLLLDFCGAWAKSLGEGMPMGVETIQGLVYLKPGDWIVRIDGNDYSVLSAKKFKERYISC